MANTQAQKDYGKIDVIVNNASYGVDGAFEKRSDKTFETERRGRFDSNCKHRKQNKILFNILFTMQQNLHLKVLLSH